MDFLIELLSFIVRIPVVVFVICFVIIAIFYKEATDLHNQRKPVKESLQSIHDFLSNFDSEINKTQFQELDAVFCSNKLFKNQWKEFSETIIDTEDDNDKVYNTEQIEKYFNRQSIIDLYVHTNHLSTIPSVLTGLGLLGTFVSILIGLYHVHVNGTEVIGIEPLINGLSGKFCSSIVGLVASIVFSYYYNGIIKELEDLVHHLQTKINGLFSRSLSEKTLIKIASSLEKIYGELSKEKETIADDGSNKALIANLSEQIKGFRADVKDDITRTGELLGNINKEIIENLTEQFKNLRTESRDSNEKIIQILDGNFKETNKHLNEAVTSLAKGATEEIIKALQEVIQDFNNNITEQFGENFKELNKAVFKLVEWQENYKTSIQELEKGLQTSISTLNSVDGTLESIANRNKEVLDVYSQLQEIITAHHSQLELINQRLDEYSKLNIEAKRIVEEIRSKFNDSITGFNKNCDGVLATIMNSHEGLYKSFETTSMKLLEETQEHIKLSTEALGKNLESTYKALDKVSEKIQISLSSQSENLTKLSNTLPEHSQVLNKRLTDASNEIEKQLTQSLGQMESALTGLTKQFEKNYDSYLKNQPTEAR